MNNFMLKKFKINLFYITLFLVFILFLSWHPTAFASDMGLAEIIENITTSIKGIGQLLVYIAYIAGIGFAFSGIMGFKAHKDSPTQTPLSKPFIYLIVSGCLLYLPEVMNLTGDTIFNSHDNKGSKYRSDN